MALEQLLRLTPLFELCGVRKQLTYKDVSRELHLQKSLRFSV